MFLFTFFPPKPTFCLPHCLPVPKLWWHESPKGELPQINLYRRNLACPGIAITLQGQIAQAMWKLATPCKGMWEPQYQFEPKPSVNPFPQIERAARLPLSVTMTGSFLNMRTWSSKLSYPSWKVYHDYDCFLLLMSYFKSCFFFNIRRISCLHPSSVTALFTN